VVNSKLSKREVLATRRQEVASRDSSASTYDRNSVTGRGLRFAIVVRRSYNRLRLGIKGAMLKLAFFIFFFLLSQTESLLTVLRFFIVAVLTGLLVAIKVWFTREALPTCTSELLCGRSHRFLEVPVFPPGVLSHRFHGA
jgi:hypothetical protein